MADPGHPTSFSFQPCRHLLANALGFFCTLHLNAASKSRHCLLIILGMAMSVSFISLPLLFFQDDELHLEHVREIGVLIDVLIFASAAFIWWRTSASEMDYHRARHALEHLMHTRYKEHSGSANASEEIDFFDATLHAVIYRLHQRGKHGDREAARIVKKLPFDADFADLQQYLLGEQESLREQARDDEVSEQYLEVTYQAALVCYLCGNMAKAGELIRQSLLLEPCSPACTLLLHAHILRDEGSVGRASACYRKVLDLEVEQEDDLSKSIAFENLRMLQPALQGYDVKSAAQ